MARARRAPFFQANLAVFYFRSSITRSGIEIAATGAAGRLPLVALKRSTYVMMTFREPLPYQCVECQNRIGKDSQMPILLWLMGMPIMLIIVLMLFGIA